MTIVKKIHYCWFGHSPLPDLAIKCINSWRKFLPDYEIIEWNESNFDLNICTYVKESYEAKKWAFVSDYARFWILYNFGGLYFDTDVELIAPLDDIVSSGSFMGFEKSGFVAPGLGIGCEAHNSLYKEILDYYSSISFYKYPGVPSEGNVVSIISGLLRKYGLKDEDVFQQIANINIYPSDYFCPIDYRTGQLTITRNTVSIHHYMASWIDPLEQKIIDIESKYKFGRLYSFGYRLVNKIKKLGFKKTAFFIIWKIYHK